MTRKEEREAEIRAAQTTYLLTGGDKEHMVVVIPKAWRKDFPTYDWIEDPHIEEPKVISRSAFYEAIRAEMNAMNTAALQQQQQELNRQLYQDAKNVFKQVYPNLTMESPDDRQ